MKSEVGSFRLDFNAVHGSKKSYEKDTEKQFELPKTFTDNTTPTAYKELGYFYNLTS